MTPQPLGRDARPLAVHRGLVRSLTTLSLLPLLAQSASAGGDDPLPTTLAGDAVTMSFDAADPDLGFALFSIGDADDAAAFSFARTHLWEVEFQDPANPGTTFVALPDRSQGYSFTFEAQTIDDDWDDWGWGDDDDDWGGWGGDDDDDGGGWGGDDDDDGGGWGGDDDDDGGWGWDDDPVGLELCWNGVTHPDFPNGECFDVEVRLEIEDDNPYVSFEIEIRGIEPFPSQVLTQRFPRVEVIGGPNGAAERIAVPFWQGNLYNDPIRNPELVVASTSLPPETHPGPLNMQWLAYYDESDPDEAMFYWATRDGEGFPKGFRIDPNPFSATPSLGLSIEHVPVGNGDPGICHETPFQFTFGVLRGDWYEAARFYREDWALDQPSLAGGPMRENPDFSQTVLDADLFGILSHDFCPVDPPACAITGMRRPDLSNWAFAAQHFQEVRDFFGTDDVLYQVSNWERNSFTANWGEWLPPQPAFEQFFRPQAEQLGLDWAPYFNTLLYDTGRPEYISSTLPGFEGRFGGDFSIVRQDGLLQLEDQIHCDLIDPCNPTLLPELSSLALIDQGTPWATEYALSILTALEDSPTSTPAGAYLDVLQESTQLSYSQAAEDDGFHARGGGSYATEGTLATIDTLTGTLRDQFGKPDYFLMGEAPYEPAIGQVEFTFGYHGGARTLDGVRSVVPIFQTVYHDYQRTGSILGLDIPPTSPFIFDPTIWLSARQIFAANLWMGHAPYATTRASAFTFAIRTNPALFPDLARHLEMARDYTQLVSLDDVRDTVVFGQRLRSPQTDAGRSLIQFLLVNDLNPIEQTQPVVYVSAFGTPGPEGPIGLLVTNWTDASDLLFDPFFGLPLWEPGTLPGPQTVTITIDPQEYGLDPLVYEVKEVVAATGETVVLADSLDLTNGPGTIAVDVEGRTGRFLLIEADLPPSDDDDDDWPWDWDWGC